MPRLDKIPFNQFNLHVVATMDLYFASADHLETVCCFLVFQEMGELSKRTNYPVRDCHVKGQLPNSNHTIHIVAGHIHDATEYPNPDYPSNIEPL